MNRAANWVARVDAPKQRSSPPCACCPPGGSRDSEAVWLRGPAVNDALASPCKRCPDCGASRASHGQLIAEGGACRKEGLRSALAAVARGAAGGLPTALGATGTGEGAALRWCVPRPCASQCPLTDFARAGLVESAAKFAAAGLRFAAGAMARVDRGHSPPAIPGQRFHVRDGVACPAARPARPIPGARAAALAGAGRGRHALPTRAGLGNPEGRTVRPRLRSAVRSTAEAVGHE